MIESIISLTIGWAALAQDIEAMAGAGDAPAAAVAFVDDGKIVHIGGIGAAEESTPFRVGSITKSVVALTALEWLDPDTVIALENVTTAFEEPLKLQHLLEHSAGLPELTREEFSSNEPIALGTAVARRRETLSPPGFVRSYSNVNPGYTARLIESVTGKPFSEAVATTVFEPLDIDASFGPSTGLPGGYRADGKTPIPYWHMTFDAMGALNISARDFAKLLVALVNEGRFEERQVFRTETIDALLTRRSTGIAVGHAAGTRTWIRDGHLFSGHGGDADGYRSHFGIHQASRRGYFVAINVDNPTLLGRMRARIERVLTQDLEPPSALPRREEDLRHLTGRFYPARVRFGDSRWRRGELDWFDVAANGGDLVVRGRRSYRLVPVGEGRFRRADDPVVTAIARVRKGVTFLTGPFGDIARLPPECHRPTPWPDGFLQACLWR